MRADTIFRFLYQYLRKNPCERINGIYGSFAYAYDQRSVLEIGDRQITIVTREEY
jgi:hypothetical protein